MNYVVNSFNERSPLLRDSGGTLDTASLVLPPSQAALPFVDTKRQEIRAKRVLHDIHAATSPSEQGRSSGPPKHRRVHSLMSEGGFGYLEDGSESGEDVGTAACYDFPSSCHWQTETEGKSDLTLLPGNQFQKYTFGINEAPSRESPLQNNIFESCPLAGTLAQFSDTDEKTEDWPTNLLTELDDARNNDNHTIARSLGREETGSPFVNGGASSPTARSPTLESTFESCDVMHPISTTTFSPDIAPEVNGASSPSSLCPVWTVADLQRIGSESSEEEADELVSSEATGSEGIQLSPGEAAGSSNLRQGDGLGLTVARPAAAILRALGPPRGTYALAHLYAGPASQQTSSAITPGTFPPQVDEPSASSGTCTLREPGTVQHHRSPGPPDSVHKANIANTPPLGLILPPAAAPPADSDPVIRFLEELGLSPSLAVSLRRVGISDDNRIRAIGALPRGPMDRIEKAESDALRFQVGGAYVDEDSHRNATASRRGKPLCVESMFNGYMSSIVLYQ